MYILFKCICNNWSVACGRRIIDTYLISLITARHCVVTHMHIWINMYVSKIFHVVLEKHNHSLYVNKYCYEVYFLTDVLCNKKKKYYYDYSKIKEKLLIFNKINCFFFLFQHIRGSYENMVLYSSLSSRAHVCTVRVYVLYVCMCVCMFETCALS